MGKTPKVQAPLTAFWEWTKFLAGLLLSWVRGSVQSKLNCLVDQRKDIGTPYHPLIKHLQHEAVPTLSSHACVHTCQYSPETFRRRVKLCNCLQRTYSLVGEKLSLSWIIYKNKPGRLHIAVGLKGRRAYSAEGSRRSLADKVVLTEWALKDW